MYAVIVISRKYIIQVSGVGIAVVLIIFATSCQPLLPSQIVQIARQNINPACLVQSYNIEIPDFPQNPYSVQPLSSNTISGTPASNVSTSIVSVNLDRLI